MDFSTLKPNERIWEVLHPVSEEPVGIRISLVHIQDPSLRQLKRQIQDERLRLEARGKHLKSENLEANERELAFRSMKGWEWYNPTGKKGDKGFDEKAHANWNGNNAPEFNKKTVYEIFDTLPWFVDKVLSEIGDEKAFFPN